MLDARLPESEHGGTKTYVQALAEVLEAQKVVQIQRIWVVLPFTKWWQKNFKPGDSRIVSWDIPRITSSLVKKVFPVWLFRFIRGAYLGSPIEAQSKGLSKRITSLGADLVHLPIQDGFTTHLPYIYHPHDLQHLHYPEYFDEATIKHRDTRWRGLAEKSSKVICASEFVRDDLIKNWSIEPSKITVLPMPTPNPLELSDSISEVVPHSILVVANFWPHKNQETAIRAVGQIAKKYPDVTLTLVGEGPSKARCEELAQTLGLIGQVKFLGSISQNRLEQEIAQHQIVCVPSEFEAASFPIIDGMRFNKSIIASSIGPFLEVESFGVTIYGKPKDSDALAKSLESEFANSTLCESVTEKHQSYLESLDAELVGAQLVRIYLEAIQTRNHSWT